ncbi:unnamed protein product [Rhizophagus irregularis]|uniref:Uncharacterized protein n=1 Tax=Rhizophagus irregularis TaxID=588596 RepID=A0A915ZTF0_9GLOM|nr:unnamed protein product [Rhizophagus irregularis]
MLFADEYDPRQDVFDQVINALVPILIVFLFGTKGSEDKEEPERSTEANSINSKGSDEEKAELKLTVKQTFKIVTSKLTFKGVFEDLLYLSSLYILPSIVFYKNHEKFAIPLWIPILSVVTTGVVIILVVLSLYNFLAASSYSMLKEFIFDFLVHIFAIINEICFIFYTNNTPANNINLD